MLSKVLHPLQFAVATAVKVLFFSIVIPCSVFCSHVRHFPQPEFFAFLNLFSITLQTALRSSTGYGVTNIVYYHSTLLDSVQTHIEQLEILLQNSRNIHFLSHIPTTMLEERCIFYGGKKSSHSQFFFIIPQPYSVLRLLQPFTPD